MSIRCNQCGYEWDNEDAFVRYRPSFRIQSKHICRSCWRRRFESRLGMWFVELVLLGLVGAAVAFWHPKNIMGWILLNLVIFDLCGFISALIHELGHAFAAKLVGMRVFLVQVGGGRQLFGKEMFGFRLQFHRHPLLGGATYAGHVHQQGLLWRQWVYIAAGPLSNLALCGLLLIVIDSLYWEDVINSALTGVVFAPILFFNSFIMFIVNMIPMNSRRFLGGHPSDGKQLLKLLRPGADYIDNALEGSFVVEAFYLDSVGDYRREEKVCRDGLSRYPQSKMLMNNLSVVLLNTGRYEEGRKQLVELLETSSEDECSGLPRALILNNIAWANLMMGDKGLLSEADEYSRLAYCAFNDVASFKNTRGAVLIELGDVDEGIKLITSSSSGIDKHENRALNSAYLVLGEWKRGNKEKARAHLEDVKRFDEDCPLLPRVLEIMSDNNRLPTIA